MARGPDLRLIFRLPLQSEIRLFGTRPARNFGERARPGIDGAAACRGKGAPGYLRFVTIIPFAAGRAAVRSTQVVMHHFPQAERQVRHAVHRRDHFQDWQLRDRRQRVWCE